MKVIKDVNVTSMKNNLIQNFYVIGYSLEDFFQMKTPKKGAFSDILKDPLTFEITPKLISKFPNFEKNNNSVPDYLIISHCFPKGLKIINNVNDVKVTHFEFNLDNIPSNYIDEEKSIYSKIYFNCLEFFEPLSQYVKLKKEIIESSTKHKIDIENLDKNEKITEETENKFSSYYIPKVICFASLLPFGKELKDILNYIYNYYLANLFIKDNSTKNNLIPLEKFIEEIVIKTPAPISSDAEISITFKFSNVKANPNVNLNFEKITFPVYNMKEPYIKYYQSLSLGECFNYFPSVDDIMKIFRYMLLEIPLLFFSKDKSALSLFVNNFSSLLNPFVYVLPHIAILPNELYGLINSEPKFIFGINENYYENFFVENNIDLDKSIVVINLNSEKKSESKIKEINNKMEDSECLVINEQTKKKDNDRNTDEYIFYNGSYVNLLSIELPSYAKKKTTSALNTYITAVKKKTNLSDTKKLMEQDFNYKIQNIFFKFFLYIMSGYNDNLLNSKYFGRCVIKKNEGDGVMSKNEGDDVWFKNADKDFIRELFNLEEFITLHSKDTLFYSAFCNTKLFMNFFREKIYSNNVIDIFRQEHFDQLAYLKKHKDARKKADNKGLYENFRKCIMDKDPIKNNTDIAVSNELYFSRPETLEILKDNNQFIVLSKYGQLIKGKVKKGKNFELPTIHYFVFPKLLFDDSFFSENYETLLVAHCLNVPKDTFLKNVKNSSIVYSKNNVKFRKDMKYDVIVSKLNETNNSSENFEVKYNSYIYFSWLMLLSCSLWYCEPIERNIRINKIFELLNKLEYIEEQVLLFLFINIYRYGNKYQFIKMHKINLKFVGYSNYFFLNLLYNKLKQKEEESKNDIEEEQGNTINTDIKEENEEEEKDEEHSLEKRFLVDTNGKLIKALITKNIPKYQRRRTNEDPKVLISNDKEEIVFSTEQFCPKCGNVINIVPDDLIKDKIDAELNFFKYKCDKCVDVENEAIIKYHILLSNFQKKEAIVVGEGEYKLSTPYKFYESIKAYFQKRKNYELDIENIFKEKELNLPNIIFYFSIINLPFDFLLPYKDKGNDLNKKKIEEKKEENEFVPIKIYYDNDDVYRRFNDLFPLYVPKRRFFRRNNNEQAFTILGQPKKEPKKE